MSQYGRKGQHRQSTSTWELAFRKSRWLIRGWTFQELIALTVVDFYSSEGERVGSKLSLEPLVHKITGIARNALRGDALSNFSIDERGLAADLNIGIRSYGEKGGNRQVGPRSNRLGIHRGRRAANSYSTASHAQKAPSPTPL